MRFSIVIPAYCAEQTLLSCLVSLKQQSFTDFEAIIVDDGSNDSTACIAKDFLATDNRFRYIYQEKQGVSVARNCGIAHSKGDFIAFLDSDDRYDVDYLSEFQKMTLAYPDCDYFWCGYKSVSVNGTELDKHIWPSIQTIDIVDRSAIMNLRESALDSALWNKVFRRQIIHGNNISMIPNLSLGEDLLFNYEYLDVCCPSIAICNKPLYIYTKAENDSLDSKYRADLFEIYNLVNSRILEYLLKWNLPSDQMPKYYSSVFYSLERVLRNTYKPESQMTAKEKRVYNNSVIHSEMFQETLKKSDCNIHPLYRFAYYIGSWGLVRFLNKLVEYKGKCTRRK